MKRSFRDACVNVCTGDLRPTTLFETENFTKLVQLAVDLGAERGKFDAKQLISDRTAISREVQDRAKKERDDMKPEIQRMVKEGRCAATMDMWTEQFNQRHYLTCTAHYIKDDWTLTSCVLFTKLFEDPETGANINRKVTEWLGELYGIESEDISKIKFTMDGASNMKKTAEEGNFFRLRCTAHNLNIVLRTSFSLKMVDLDLLGECGRDVYDTLVLAIQLIKKSGRGQLKRLNLLELPARDGRDRVYKSFVPALEIAISKSVEVTEIFNVRISF